MSEGHTTQCKIDIIISIYHNCFAMIQGTQQQQVEHTTFIGLGHFLGTEEGCTL